MSTEVKFFTCEIMDDTWSTHVRTHRCTCPVCKGANVVAEKPGVGYQVIIKCQHFMGASATMPPHVVVCFMMEQPKPEKKGWSFRV
jgi:hypothetical protein